MSEDVKQQKAMSGAQMIDNERTRQIYEEQWSATHDNGHGLGELIGAAITYSGHALEQITDGDINAPEGSQYWPWGAAWWKPSPDPIRNLVKAGALIAAEIDRLQRLNAKEVSNG
jgi:hypothetical protein